MALSDYSGSIVNSQRQLQGGDVDRVRILLIAQNLPYPTFSGMDLRNWQNVNGLLSVGEVGVFGLCSNDTHRSRPPDACLAFWRSTQDPDLSFPPPVGRQIAARAWLLDPLGHPGDMYYSDSAVDELKLLLTGFQPEIVALEGLWMHRYIELLKAHGCRIILDCHDTLAPQTQQLADLNEGDDLRSRLIRKILPERVKLIENRAAHAVDQLWVCSSREAELMERLYHPPCSIHVVPNGVDVSVYDGIDAAQTACPQSSTVAAKTLVFPAMFAYEPNRLAAAFLIKEVFPRLTNVFSDCRLLLPGSWPTAQMLDAAKNESRIVVTGVVPDMRPYLAAASAMVVPLFQGSGTRMKILEAFAARLPVISTSKGAEGLDVENEIHLLIAETAEEFVACLQRLWNDPTLASKLTENGLQLVKRDYSWEAATRRISVAMNEVRTKPVEMTACLQ
jgi:glycosyltransferase involved in cell wall biosynthesis